MTHPIDCECDYCCDSVTSDSEYTYESESTDDDDVSDLDEITQEEIDALDEDLIEYIRNLAYFYRTNQ